MTQSVRLRWVLLVATLNAVFALAVGGMVAWGLRSARTPPQPVTRQLSCPAPPDAQLSQTLQLLAAGQQAMMLRALQPPPAATPPTATAPQPTAARQRPARRSARRSRRLRPVCRAK